MKFQSIMVRVPVLSALRFRDFRLYWFGHLASVSGHQMFLVVQGWLVYELTGSPLWLGVVGIAEAVPSIGLTLFGGVAADKVDQRRLLVLMQWANAAALLVLGTLTSTEVIRAWHIVAFAFVWGTIGAFDQPARQALFPHLVDRQNMMSAVGMNSTVHPGTRIAGPAVAGVIIAQVAKLTGMPFMGAAVVLYLAAVWYAVFGIFLLTIRVPRVPRAQGRNILHDVVEGLRVIWRDKVILFLIGMVFFTSYFGGAYIILLPIFAKDILGGGASLLGFLFAAGGVGSLSGAIIGASLGNYRRRGWVLFFGAALQGVALVAFSLSHWAGVSLVVLPLVGVGFSLFNVTAQTTIQLMVPDEFRGRVMGVWGMTHTVVMPTGRMQAGAVANFSETSMVGLLGRIAGAPFAVALGGLLVVAFAAVGAARNHQVRRLGVHADTLQGVGGQR